MVFSIRSRFRLGIALGVAVLLTATGSASAADGDANAEILRLQAAIRADPDPASVDPLLDRMQAIDPEHPQLFISIYEVLWGAGLNQEAHDRAQRYGTPDGPGRSFGQGLLTLAGRGPVPAEPHYSRALAGYESAGHERGQATTLHHLGMVAGFRGRPAEAAEFYARAVEIHERVGDLGFVVDSRFMMAEAIRDAGRPREAAEAFAANAGAADKLDKITEQARAWCAAGEAYLAGDSATDAMAAFDRAEAVESGAGLDTYGLRIARGRAMARAIGGDVDGALADLAGILASAEAAQDRSLAGIVLLSRGELYLNSDRPGEARRELDHALQRFQPQDGAERVRARAKLGLALLDLGEYLDARDTLQAALRQAVARGYSKIAALARTDLAKIALITGEFADGLVLQNDAMRWFEEVGHPRGTLVGAQNLGALYYRLGDLDTAREYVDTALDLARQVDDPKLAALAWNNLGVLLAEAEETSGALDAHTKAIELLRGVNPAARTSAEVNAARMLHRLGRGGQARTLLDDAIERTVDLQLRSTEAFARNVSGLLHRESGKTKESLAAYREALAVGERFGIADQTVNSHWGMGDTYRDAGDPKAALEQYRKAIEVLEQRRVAMASNELRLRFFAEKNGLFEQAIAALVRVDPSAIAEAFELAEQSRARATLDLLAASRIAIRQRVPPELQKKESDGLARLSAAARRLREATDEEEQRSAREALRQAELDFAAVQVELSREAEDYARLAYPEPVTLAAAQQSLTPGETLLEYFVGETHAWRFTVTRDSARLDRIPTPAEIGTLAGTFLEELGRAGVSLSAVRDARPATGLGDAVLPEEFPAGTRRVIVAADGPLHRIPFDALMRAGRYLVLDYEVTVVPSSTVLRWMRAGSVKRAPGGFLGLGAPTARTPEDPRFPALPDARKALEQIGAGFPVDDRRVVVGDDLLISEVRSLPFDDYRYVHFATHGWIDAAEPRLSGLLLSDDFLGLDDILGLPLNAELVVLSACRSATGELLRGEGFVSMTRAVLYAGSDAVLASLWNVNDRSTAEFMTAFYRELALGPSVPAALRRTKIAVLKSPRRPNRQPYRWAPFVLIGDSRIPDPHEPPRAGTD